MARDMAEELFQAVDTLINKRIEKVRFDETVEATVKDDAEADRGKYVLTTGDASFVAYSASDTKYKKGEAVLVTIPQGDFDKQKMIIGRQTGDNDTAKEYISPLASIVDATGNLIYSEINEIGIKAQGNENQYTWEWDLANKTNTEYKENFVDSAAYKNQSIIWDSGEINESGFTRIGLAAKFKTFLNSYKLKTGTYGVMLEVSFTAKEYEGENKTISKFFPLDSSDFFGNIYGFNSFVQQEIAYDISGPEYENFVITRLRLYSYQRQDFFDKTGTSPISEPELNIFIKDFYVCLGIALEDFKGDDAHLISLDGSYTFSKSSSLLDSIIPFDEIQELYSYITGLNEDRYYHYEFNDNEELYSNFYQFLRIVPNLEEDYSPAETELFVKVGNFYQNYGEQHKSQFELMSVDKNKNNFYYKRLTENPTDIRNENNIKKIFCRWIHKNETSKVIKALMQEELPEDYEIRWYRYKLGLPSVDAFGGAHWDRFYGIFQLGDNIQYWKIGEDVDIVNNDIKLYKQKRDELIAQQEYNLTSSLNLTSFPDNATNKIQIDFIPNPNYEQEQFKVVILKKHITNNNRGQPETTYSKITESNIITFTNNDRVRNPATYNDENALSIKAEDGTFGSYLIYDRAGQASKGEDKEIRTLTAVFDINQKDVWKKPELNNFTSIEWWFPTENTMIIPLNEDQTGKADMPTEENLQGRYGRYFTGKTRVSYIISPTLDRSATNNTVRIEVVKDGLPYTAYLEMIFGTAGTSGSDYTIDIRWDDKSKAVAVKDDNSVTSLEGTLVLYDSNNYPIDIPSTANVQLSWDKVYVGTIENNNIADVNKYGESVKEEDNSNLYYPIIKYPLTMNKNQDPENPVADRLMDLTSDYYFTNNNSSGSNNNSSGFVEFNLEKKIFEASTSTIKQLYRKRDAASENKKSKLVFKPIETTVDGTSWEEDIKNGIYGALTKYADGTTLYFWNQYRRCFVKVDNYFIIDPWDSYQEAETYYYPIIDASEKEYTSNLLTHNYTDNRVTISGNSSYSKDTYLNSLHILKVTISNFGDYDLVAYFPIPIKYEPEGLKVDGIVGPTYVRYSVSGEVDFDKNPYGMFIREQESGNWVSTNREFTVNLIGKDIVDENDEDADTKFSPLIKNKMLQPLGVYFKEAELYGVQFKDSNNNILWTQPILVYQDNYPSTTLNKWNGKDILTKQDSGIIVANGFAAGKKESDNTFTGVVLGDWSREKDTDRMLTKETGVFGFNHGAMSYALKDDGTAFFGKDGRGRIYLNGNKAQIYSSGWIADKDDKYGMFMDIDDGKLEIVGRGISSFRKLEPNYIIPKGQEFYELANGAYTSRTDFEYDILVRDDSEYYLSVISHSKILLDSSQEYFSITHPNGQKLIEINGNGKYYLQSQDFSVNNKKGVKFDLGEGNLTGYDFTIEAERSNTVQAAIYSFMFEVPPGAQRENKDYFRFYNNLSDGRRTFWAYSYNNYTVPSDFPLGLYELHPSSTAGYYQAYNLNDSSDVIERPFSYTVGQPIYGDITVDKEVNGGKITISSENEKPLQIGDNFSVDWDGTLHALKGDFKGNISGASGSFSGTITATEGSIGGIEIGDDGIYSSNYSHSNTGFKIASTGEIIASNVNLSGKINATSGTIGGWDISDSQIYKGNTILKSSEGSDGALEIDTIKIWQKNNEGTVQLIGQIGHYTGYNGVSNTDVLGIETEDTINLALNSGGDIALNTALNKSIYFSVGQRYKFNFTSQGYLEVSGGLRACQNSSNFVSNFEVIDLTAAAYEMGNIYLGRGRPLNLFGNPDDISTSAYMSKTYLYNALIFGDLDDNGNGGNIYYRYKDEKEDVYKTKSLDQYIKDTIRDYFAI